MPESPCLTEELIAELVEGRLQGASFESAERHIADCRACMRLVDEAGGALASHGATVRAGDDPCVLPPLPRGARVGRYEILAPVGAGGMGRVYAAHDPVLDRRVALKLLHPHAATDELETRLLREAKAMARLSHSEVITVHDAGRFGDQLFIAMEFVEGGTLRRWLTDRRRPWREVLAVFLRAGGGLARAHEAGIVHRDFKPDNVLVGGDGRVRVTDFGLARAVLTPESPVEPPPESPEHARTVEVTLTRTGTLLGTPAYMAPEQHAGAPADERSDVFSFCVALYEGLYGVRPFAGSTLAQLAAQKREGKVRAPKDERGVPQRLRRALLVGLRPEPDRRYASMPSLLLALERASSPRRRWALTAGSAALLLAAGGSALAVWSRWGTGAERNRSEPTAVTSTPRECTSHAGCVASHGGEAYACRAVDGVCVAMASEDCTPMFEPEDLAGDTVWLGAMFPRGPSYGKMNMDAVDMARRELSRETSAMSGSNASMHFRRIAVVGCDDGVDARRAANHLVDDVGVPAIIGFASGKELVELAGSLLVQRHVVSVATLTTSPLIMRLPQPADLPRMVWRTSYSIETVADATAAFLPVIERRTAAPRTRVTLARQDISYVLPFAQRLYRDVRFNGKSAPDNGGDYREVVLATGADAGADAAPDAIVQGDPTVVVLIGPPPAVLATVQAVEARWPASQPRPTYLIADDTTATLGPFIGGSAERRRRVFALSAASIPTTTAHFVLRFNLAHPGEATETINPGVTYDAFYLVAYGVLSLGDRPVTGPAISGAIPRLLPPGRPVETGSTDVYAALSTLARGENIDLSGPSGSLDFDPVTGDWSPDFTLLCPAANGRSDVESGVSYVAKTRAVEGHLRCP